MKLPILGLALNKKVRRKLIYAFFGVLCLFFVLKITSRYTDSSYLKNIPILGDETIQVSDLNVVTDITFQKCRHFFGFAESCSSLHFYHDLDDSQPEKKTADKYRVYRVNKDLLLSKSWFSKIYLVLVKTNSKNVQEQQLPTVQKLAIQNAIVTENEKLDVDIGKIPLEVYHDAKSTDLNVIQSKGWHDIGYGFWFKTSSQLRPTTISDLNVLFGRQSVDPRPGWSSLNTPLLMGQKASLGKLDTEININRTDYHQYDGEAYIYYKVKDSKIIPDQRTKLKVAANGKFKIVQISDMHLSTGYGKCLDPYPAFEGKLSHCLADEITLEFVKKVLDIENPDMVVLTGDQIFGESSPDSETALLKAVSPLIERGIPYAMVFGNHDDEGGSMDREQLMSEIQNFPYSLSSAGPQEVSGVGNYPIFVNDVTGDPIIIMYFLDSHSYCPGKARGYDWFKEDQKEVVKKWHNYFMSTIENSEKKPISLAFFHIPLFEYRNAKPESVTGSFKEPIMSSNINSNMYDIFKEVGVDLVSVGHDHCNDFCFKQDFAMCYGGASGEGGYAGYGGTTRRIRTFEIDTNDRSIKSWKRLQTNPYEIFDETLFM